MRVNTTTEHEAPLHLQFDDNQLLPHLYGKQDEHLTRIEEKLGVSITSRGNRLAIDGPPERIRSGALTHEGHLSLCVCVGNINSLSAA